MLRLLIVTLFFTCISLNFLATDYFWINDSGNWSDFSAHWATTSGGTTMQTNPPTSSDNVFFDAASFSVAGQTVNMDISNPTCGDMDWTGATNFPAITGVSGDVLDINGALTLSAAMTNNFLGKIYFSTGSTKNVNLNGIVIVGDCEFDGIGTWNLTSAFVCNGNMKFTSGTFKTNNFLLQANTFDVTGLSPRGLELGSSDFIITGSDNAWQASNINFFFTPGTSTIRFTNFTNDTVEVISGGTLVTYNNVSIECNLIYFEDEMAGNAISTTLFPEIIVASSQTQYWTQFNLNGNCAGYVSIHSDSLNVSAMIDVSGVITNNYLILQDITGSTGTFTANNSINNGNVTTWTVNEPASSGYVYWIGNTGNWSIPTNWSTGCVPGPQDTIVFNAASFSGINDIVTVDINGYGYSMIWNGVIGNPVLAGSGFTIFLRNSATFDASMTSTYNGDIEFNGPINPGIITSNGVILNGNIVINGTASWQIADPLTSNADLILENGTFSTNNQNLSTAHFNTNFTTTRTLTLGSSIYTLTGGDQTFIVDATGLTLNVGTSEIIFNTTSINTAYFVGNNQTYNTFRIQNNSALIAGGNTFNLVEINPGSSLSLENNVTQSIDSLIANGTCASTISISAFDNSMSPAIINKTGYDTLIVNYVNINHVTANNTLPKYNLAQNSTLYNTTTGWDTTNINQGNGFYWAGNTGNWSNIANWESPSGTPATCLPNITDTVYFNAVSFSGIGQICTIDIDAYCAKMDWTGSAALNAVLTFSRNLSVRQNSILNTGVSFTNNNADASLIFLPKGNNCLFQTFEAPIDVDVLLDGNNLTDTLNLLGDLKIAPTSELYISQGTFNTNSDSITCGSFFVESTDGKNVLLNASVIQITTELDFSGTHTLNTGTSDIYVGYNNNYAIFDGNGDTFNNVTLNGNNSSVSNLTGSNTFSNLTFNAGIRIGMAASQTQNITGTFSAIGNCPNDSIFIYSDIPGTATSFNCTTTPTIEVTDITDITAFGAAITALFSSNSGGNTNITFNITPATAANYTTPYDVCLGNAATFTNTSTAYTGGLAALTFSWDFGDGSSSTATNPSYTYFYNGGFYVELTSTYTNGCSDTYLDSVRVNDADVFFSTSETDSTICAGDSVTFYISSPGASNYDFLINGTSVQSGTQTNFGTTSLSNGDVVQVNVTLNTCQKISDSIVMTVNPLPTITLASSDADNTICTGDTVTFTANGADQYQFYIDGVAQGSYSNSNIFTVSDLTNGQTVTVEGKDTITICNNFSATSFTFTVNPLPVPTFTTSDADLIICQGDLVTFTANSVTNYEFFVNGISQQGPSATATFNTTSLNNGDIVTLNGSSLGCTSTSTNLYNFFVNPIPNVTTTNTTTGNVACDVDNITINATGASIYEFFINGTSVFGPSGSPSYSTSALINGDVVTVVGNLNSCLSTSAPETFTINPNPTVTLLSSDPNNTICFAEAVTFTANGASNYEYFIDGISAQGPNTMATFTSNSILNGQTISAIGTTAGCSSSGNNNYQFVVNPPFAVNFYCSDIDRTICEGESIGFTATGSGVTQYDLSVDGILTATNTTGNFTLTTLTAGSYVVWVDGTKNGCIKTSDTTFNITVNPIPIVSVVSSDADNIICANDSTYFIGSGANNYEFFIDGFSQGGLSANDSLLTTNLLNGQVISIFGETNGCSANGTNTITMTVNPVPVSTITSSDLDNIICAGENILFTGSGGTTYEFFINGVSVQGLSATTAYTSSTLNSGDIITVTTTQNNCSSNPAGITVTVNPNPVITATISDADTSICEGTPITVTATGASTYEFFINGASTGPASVNNTFTSSTLTNGQIITMQGTSNFGCSATSTDVFTWQVYATPILTTISSDADGIICNGDIVSFNASGADSINFYIDGNWILDGTNYTSDSILNGQVITVNGFSNGCATATTSSYPFTVYNYPIVEISTNIVNNELCTGDTAIVIGFGGLTYEFFLDGISIQGPSSQDSLLLPNLTNGQTVYVDAINNGCASTSNNITYTVNTTPVVSMTSSDPNSDICLGENVTFIASGASQYDFIVDNISQTGITASNTFSTTNLENSDTITVIGYNSICGATSTNNFVFIVNTMNIGLATSTNNVICNGESVTFTASGANEYEFFIDGTSVQGPSTMITYTNPNLTDGQIITVQGTDYATSCVQESFNSQLFVVLQVPTVTPAGSFTLCEGDSINLVSSYPTWNQWYVDAIEIPGENNVNYYATTSGTYDVSISLGGQNEVWSVGKNSLGQLGDSTWTSSTTTLQTLGVTVITQVDAGEYFTIALDNAGVIYSWGENDFGQLGDGTFGTANFANVINSNNFTQIAAGYHHSLAILNDGTLMSWGKNTQGQLGFGNTNTTNFPTAITGPTNVIDISAGENHSLALLSNGNVMAWGDNQYGQLGDGSLTDKTTPVLIGLSNIADIDAGANHSMAIDNTGRVWVWGNNAQGQLGLSNTNFSLSPTLNGLTNVRIVSGGKEHSLAIKTNNKLYTWGNNTFGQLGIGNNTSTSTPTLNTALSGINSAECGIYNTFVVKTDNSVWSFGKDSDAQLGDENFVDENTPIRIIPFTGATDFGLSLQHTSYLASFETSCPSNQVVVTVQTATPVSVIDFDSLLVASQSGVSYQWYINGLPITNGTGTGQSIIATSGGYYSVDVTYANGCTVTSPDFPFNIVGIDEENIFNLNFYPNPSSGVFTYNSDNLPDNYQLIIYDIHGKLIQNSILIQNQGMVYFELNVESGMYFYSIISNQKIISSSKLVVEK